MTHIRARLIFTLSLITTTITFVAMIALALADAYVRWKLNQQFSFLGDFGMLALSIAFVGQMAALIVASRSSQ